MNAPARAHVDAQGAPAQDTREAPAAAPADEEDFSAGWSQNPVTFRYGNEGGESRSGGHCAWFGNGTLRTKWPFGEEITAQGQDDLTHKYTGHERDFESNMDYMMARYYHQFQGRFLSPDPATYYDKTKPQSFNLYAYSLNNPLRYTDPTGESWWDTFVNWLTGKDDEEEEEEKEEEKEEEQAESPAVEGPDASVSGDEYLEDATPTKGYAWGKTSGFGAKTNQELSEAGKQSAEWAAEGAVVVAGVKSIKSLAELSGIKNVSGKDLIKTLEKFGAKVRGGKGSHIVVELGGKTTSIPQHGNKSLGKGLLNKILKDLGLKE